MLNARMTQMAGQTTSPIQKILDSDSGTCCFPEVWKKQHNNNKGIVSVNATRTKRSNMRTTRAGDSHLPGLKQPLAASVIVHLVPPPQADHQPPCDVLESKQEIPGSQPIPDPMTKLEMSSYFDRPEVTGEQEDDRHHAGDEAAAEELAKQIGEDGGDPEEEVEEGGQRVPADVLNQAYFSCRVKSNICVQEPKIVPLTETGPNNQTSVNILNF